MKKIVSILLICLLSACAGLTTQPTAAEEKPAAQAAEVAAAVAVAKVTVAAKKERSAGGWRTEKRLPTKGGGNNGHAKSGIAIEKTLTPGVFWNSWMEESDGLPVSDLAVDQAYRFIIDLSRYQYILKGSAAASTALGSEIKKARLMNRKKITLTVRPILAGSALEWRPDARSEYYLEVDVEKLAPPTNEQLERDLIEWTDHLSGQKKLNDISELFRAAHLSIPMLAKNNGCAHVALSIWDEAGTRPLDHVVHTVSVGEKDACGIGVQSTVSAGFSTLLETLPNPGYPPTPAEAALHIFELPGSNISAKAIALFVDATNKPPAVYSWSLETSIGRYVSEPDQLLRMIGEARTTKDYSNVAKELQAKIFTAVSGSEATHAMAALKRIVDESKTDPVILARITSVRGTPVYLPLSLLSSANPPLLARRINVVHPSPEPSPVLTPTCVKPWTFAVPRTLSQHIGDVVMEPDNSWINDHRQGTLSELRTYFGEPSPSLAKPSLNGEGLLLLAHQANGNLWFGMQTDRVGLTDLKKQFSPGSVAILSACSAANPDGDNDMWINKMSRLGVDTIFASPFPIPLKYGVKFTRRFIHAVRVAQEKNEATTIASLFIKASNDAADDLNGLSKDIQYEFVLIGDHDIRLCKNPEGTP